ncbi:uncharacterized protein LOC108737333 [Agrilus planipennis]|uniref:Uncharacterized protein LOC108737333 n=1 Tax=Agrilus planipennis TaxID=224129 RepID=A0A1W4WNZ6_AGRPL|nr:uncharacterized protein LOC108737333 [Agrilus planipennis]
MNTYDNRDMEDMRTYLRRFNRHDNVEFSQQSILSAIGELVKAINLMDETILVPCRLMDLKVGDEQDPTSKNQNSKSKTTTQELLHSADLIDVYNMLNSIKVDLLWGQNMEEKTTSAKQGFNNYCVISNNSQNAKGHARRPSTASVASTNSSSSLSSDSELDIGIENDSGIEEPLQVQDKTAALAQSFRNHLKGLTHCLRQLTEASEYLTSRYQHDIGNPL